MNIRTIRRIVVFTLAGCTALIVLALLVVHTPPVRRWVRDRIEQAAGPAGLRITDLDYNLFDGTAELSGVTLGTGPRPFLTADRISVDIDLGALLGGSIVIQQAAATALNIDLFVDAQGQSNVPQFGGGGGAPSNQLPNVLIQRLTAAGSFTYEDQANNAQVQLPSWTLDLTGVPGPTHTITFGLGQAGEAQYEDRALALNTLGLMAQITRDRVDLQQFQVAVPGVDLTAAGGMQGFADPDFDLRLNLGADLQPVLAFAGVEPPPQIAGHLDAAANVRNTLSDLSVNAQVAGSNLTVDRLRRVSLDAQANWSRPAGIVQVTSANIQAPQGAVAIQATWAGATPADANSASARIQRLDLAQVSRLLDLPVEIASGAAGTVTAQWQGTAFEDAAATANLRITSSRDEPAQNVIPLTGTVTAQVRNREATIAAQSLQVLGASVNASVTTGLTNPALSGTLDLQVPDVGVALSSVDAFRGVPDGETVGGVPVAGQLQASAQLTGTRDRPTAALTIEGGGIRYGPLQDLMLAASATYDPAKVAVQNARVTWNGSEVTASGSVGLEGEERPLMFTARTTDIPISDILGTLGSDVPVTGRVELQAQGQGTVAAPQISATLQGHNLVAYQAMLGELATSLSMSGRTVTVDSLRLDKPDNGGTLTAQGTYDLDTRSYSLNAQGDQIALRTLQLPGDMPVRGVVNLNVSGMGTVDNPSADVNLSVTDLDVNGRMLGEASAEARVADQRATVTADLAAFNVHAAADADTMAPYAMTVQVTADNTDLASLPWGVGEPPVRGNVSAMIEASGQPQQWRDGQASVTVSSLSLETALGMVQNAEPIRIAFANRAVNVESLQVTGAGSSLSVSGSLPLEAGVAPGTVHFEGSSDLAQLAADVAEDSGFMASGTVEVTGDLAGTLERLTPTGMVAVRDGNLSTPALKAPVEGVQLRAAIDGGRVVIDQLRASLGTGVISGQGEIPLRLFPLPGQLDVPAMTQPARLQLSLSGLALNSVADLPEGVGGTVTLSLDAQTERAELDAITATLTIPQIIVSVAGARVQTTPMPPVITLRDGVLNVERFDLSGSGTEFHLSGGASLMDRELRDVQMNGTINAGLLSGLSSSLTTAGTLRLQLAATGALNDPTVSGFVEMNDGQFSIPTPRLDAVGLNMRLALDGNRLQVERFSGDLNGGMLTVSGSVGLSGGITPQIRIVADDVYLDFPEGLQTRTTTNLQFAPQDENLLLSGSVVIHEGAYTALLDLQTALQSYLQSSGGVNLVEQRNEFLSRVRFDIGVTTEDPIVMDNNLGQLAFASNLRVVGEYYRPALTGRIDIQEDGTLRLQENNYVVERGSITFINETRIEPVLDIVANTQVRGRNITVNIATNAAGDLTTNLSSDDPSDTQADIIALLLTGKDAEELEGRQLNAAGERAAASLLLGSVTGRLSQQLQGGLGLSRVRIEPDLISQESDPTARLTIGQDITNKLELIYSMNLRNSNDQIWQANYNILPRVNLRATKQSDNSYRFDFQHDLRFGARHVTTGTSQPKVTRTIRSVQFTGEPALTESRLEDKFDVKAGDEYDFFKVRKGLDRLESLYRDEGYLEARVRLHREQPAPDAVALTVEVHSGPQVDFVFEGWPASGGLRDRVRDQWQRGVFDSQRIDLSEDQIRLDAGSEGYLQPMIDAEVQMPAANRKRVLFTITRGERYSGVEVVFRGASGILPDVLKDELKRAKLDDKMQSDPREVRRFLTQYYQQQGFLDAEVSGPDYEFNPDQGTAQIVITIKEGPQYRFGETNVSGVSAFTPAEIRMLAGIPSGSKYTPVGAQESRDRVEEEYWKKGYRDVVVDYTLMREADRGLVDVDINVMEGPVSVVEAIDVEGTDRTTEDFVRHQIAFMTGDVLDYTKTVSSRRQLYNTGAYSSVEIRTSPIGNPDVSSQLKQVRLLAKVQEPNPFLLRYGGFYDTDRGPGFIADLRNRNSLGGGRVLGFRARYDNDVHEGRVFFSQPLLRNLPLRTDAATFLRREFQRNTLDDGSKDIFITDRIGFSVQEGVQLQNKFFLTVGYRFERAHTFDVTPLFIPYDVVLRVAPLNTSLTRDTRDELLDATQGAFTSHAFELSTQHLGSSLSYWRYFGQFFKYIPLTKPSPLPFGRGLEKPRVVYAGGIRVGLANTFGGQNVLARSERFFSGGGTTIRGFKQDQLGPKDVTGQVTGGEALLVINNELRFPLMSIFDGVGFVDLGNVFPRIGDFSFTNIRKTGGAGLRVRTPYFLLRVDYGLKLDRRPGESRGAVFFSIGQAF